LRHRQILERDAEAFDLGEIFSRAGKKGYTIGEAEERRQRAAAK